MTEPSCLHVNKGIRMKISVEWKEIKAFTESGTPYFFPDGKRTFPRIEKKKEAEEQKIIFLEQNKLVFVIRMCLWPADDAYYPLPDPFSQIIHAIFESIKVKTGYNDCDASSLRSKLTND